MLYHLPAISLLLLKCKVGVSEGDGSRVSSLFLTERALVRSQEAVVLMLTKDKGEEEEDERDVLSPPISRAAMRQRLWVP